MEVKERKRRKLCRYRFSCLFFQQHPFTSQFIKSSEKKIFLMAGAGKSQWEEKKSERNCLRKCLFKNSTISLRGQRYNFLQREELFALINFHGFNFNLKVSSSH
jgi:hypothetical protein